MVNFRRSYFMLRLHVTTIILLTIHNARGSNTSDSLQAILRNKPECFFATSVSIIKNKTDKSYSSILISGNINFHSKKKINDTTNQLLDLISELCYTKFLDSIWVKNSDNFNISLIQLLAGTSVFKHSFKVDLKSQFTNSWQTQNNSNHTNRKWLSGPLLPAIFSAGYGMNAELNKVSYLNLSFTSCKISTRPKNSSIKPDNKTFFQTKNIQFTSEVGLDLKLYLKFPIGKKITIENNTTFFDNGLRKESINFEMLSSVTYMYSETIKVKCNNKIAYEFPVSDNLQYKYEMLIGYSFNKK